MKEGYKIIDIKTNKHDVLEAVRQKTGYTAAKIPSDEDVFDRISTIDEDEDELMRFFDECRVELAEELTDVMEEEGFILEDNEDDYVLVIDVPDSFNKNLTGSLNIALLNFFVYGIIARWFMYTNKEESLVYAEQSMSMLQSIRQRTMNRIFTRTMRPF